MKDFHPFKDMKESMKVQKEYDKLALEATKLESKANLLAGKLAPCERKKIDAVVVGNASDDPKERIEAATKRIEMINEILNSR